MFVKTSMKYASSFYHLNGYKKFYSKLYLTIKVSFVQPIEVKGYPCKIMPKQINTHHRQRRQHHNFVIKPLLTINQQKVFTL